MDPEKIADRAATILAGMAMRGIPPTDPEAVKEAIQAARAVTIASETSEQAAHGMVRTADLYREFAAEVMQTVDEIDPDRVRRVGFRPELAMPYVSTKHNSGK